ncbi:hypothetical protein [Bradyrhizobium liaoningense]
MALRAACASNRLDRRHGKPDEDCQTAFGLICPAILAGNTGILLALVSVILAIPIVKRD